MRQVVGRVHRLFDRQIPEGRIADQDVSPEAVPTIDLEDGFRDVDLGRERRGSYQDLLINIHIHKEDLSGLPELEKSVLSNDSDNVGASLRGGFILHKITESPELLEAAKCESKSEYLAAAPERLGVEKTTAYDWLSKATIYYRRRELLIRYGLDLESNPDFFMKGGHASKLHLLDTAMKRCVPNVAGSATSTKVQTDSLSRLRKEIEAVITQRYTEKEVMEHFQKDSYRAFKYFVKPELVQEDLWKQKWIEWKEQIVQTRKRYEYLLVFPFDSSSVDESALKDVVLKAIKEESHE